jgi:hypothetical protein
MRMNAEEGKLNPSKQLEGDVVQLLELGAGAERSGKSGQRE